MWHRRVLAHTAIVRSVQDVAGVRRREWFAVRSIAFCYIHRCEDGDTVSHSAENPDPINPEWAVHRLTMSAVVDGGTTDEGLGTSSARGGSGSHRIRRPTDQEVPNPQVTWFSRSA
jgi:hypothetical protein